MISISLSLHFLFMEVREKKKKNKIFKLPAMDFELQELCCNPNVGCNTVRLDHCTSN